MGFLQDVGDAITGKTQADAALAAADVQTQTGQAQAANLLAREGEITGQFQPFADFGAGLIPGAQQAFGQQQALFGPQAGANLLQSDTFQALLGRGQEDILGRQAALGRVGTGETQGFLQENALRTGFDVLNQERQAALANTQSFLGGVGQGQQAAGGIASALQNSILNQANLQTGAAAAEAGGLIGAANAQTAGVGNVLGLGAAALSSGFGGFGGFSNPFGGGAPGVPTNFSAGGRPVGGF